MANGLLSGDSRDCRPRILGDFKWNCLDTGEIERGGLIGAGGYRRAVRIRGVLTDEKCPLASFMSLVGRLSYLFGTQVPNVNSVTAPGE